MFDDRWPDEAGELVSALRPILDKQSTTDQLRTAEALSGNDFGRLPDLEEALTEFGLYELPPDPFLLTRSAIELGRRLSPVPFVAIVPASVVAGLEAVANGVDRTVVPGVCTRAIMLRDDELRIADVSSAPIRRSSAGELVRDIRSGDFADTGESVEIDADAVRSWGFLLEAARLIGAADALLHYGVTYVAERKQFGVPVGSFQGVSFPLADVATAVSSAELLVAHATSLAAADGAPTLTHSAMAAHKARQSARLAASVVHQVLGGYGFTVEADCQLYSRRIRAWSGEMPDTTTFLAGLARTLANPQTRSTVRDLWNFDEGFRLPAWADR